MSEDQKKPEAAKPASKKATSAARQALSAKEAKALGLDPTVYGG